MLSSTEMWWQHCNRPVSCHTVNTLAMTQLSWLFTVAQTPSTTYWLDYQHWIVMWRLWCNLPMIILRNIISPYRTRLRAPSVHWHQLVIIIPIRLVLPMSWSISSGSCTLMSYCNSSYIKIIAVQQQLTVIIYCWRNKDFYTLVCNNGAVCFVHGYQDYHSCQCEYSITLTLNSSNLTHWRLKCGNMVRV